MARQIKGARLVRISASPVDAQIPPDLLRHGNSVALVGAAETSLCALAGVGELSPVASASQAIHFAPQEVSWVQWLHNLRDDPDRFSQTK